MADLFKQKHLTFIQTTMSASSSYLSPLSRSWALFKRIGARAVNFS